MNVALIGFPPNVANTLQLGIREFAPHRFEVVTLDEADICVIDLDAEPPVDLRAIESLGCPMITISEEHHSESGQYWLQRPFKLSHLLETLHTIYDVNEPDGIKLGSEYLSLTELPGSADE